MSIPIEETERLARGAQVRAMYPGRSLEQHLQAEDEERKAHIRRARLYYEGEQHRAYNWEQAKADQSCNGNPDLLPEHVKRFAYSTQIQEAVDYLAGELAGRFQVKADDPQVDEIVQRSLSASPDLASDDDEDDLTIVNVLRNALLGGDTPALVRWDEVEETPWFEFFDAEDVRFDFDPENRFRLVRVTLYDRAWFQRVGADDAEEVPRRRVWEVVDGECVVSTFLDDDGLDPEREPDSVERQMIPFIPWRMLRAQRKDSKQQRGTSVIRRQCMAAADRYDALEQLAYVISRYNSHGNLAVIGDGALLQAVQNEKIHKDVADVLTFPGGTALQSITLPTDAQMIEHQRQVLIDALFSMFGLARVDADALRGMGQVSGYALEILNRKSNSTFAQIGQQFGRDLRSLLNLALDMYVWRTSSEWESWDPIVDIAEEGAEDGPIFVSARLPEIDPDVEFSNRKISIVFGSGYVVDDVLIRDDYTAGLTSRQEALRRRGYSEDQIQKIQDEIEEERPPEPEVGLSAVARDAARGTKTGSTLAVVE